MLIHTKVQNNPRIKVFSHPCSTNPWEYTLTQTWIRVENEEGEEKPRTEAQISLQLQTLA